MKALMFPVCVNPFGAIYNPASIVESLQMLLDGKQLSAGDLFLHQGLWHSFAFHSAFSSTDQGECLTSLNGQLSSASHFLRHTNYLFVTFGTAYAFYHQPANILVNNCHKLPAISFQRNSLSIEHIVSAWEAFMPQLWEQNPACKIIFSVSPIRHLKDGAHGNQISKATLLLSIDTIIKNNSSQCFYFPSYEYLLDDLRDYRFYTDDMCHPSSLAIDYIWEQFAQSLLAPKALLLMKEVEHLNKAKAHRPFNEHTEQHQAFLHALEQKEKSLKRRISE